ncbi:MAG TPA: sigma-70 family RNA polymerase sigma factor [Gemmataceae bacterium]|nr:sigma-70 family RNA polymerase sigma factor [Gemmataceae bacterium]
MASLEALSRLQESLLVSRARAGDSAAFRTLILSLETRLFYFIRRFVRDEHRAADVLQDVWLTVFQKLHRLREPAAFRGWVYQIAHDRAVTTAQRESRLAQTLTMDVADDAVASIDEFTRQDQAASVHRAIDRLSAEHRAVITLRFLEDLSLAEIAEVLREPLGTVKSRLYYAKESLRRLLTEESVHE